ncbi:MAG: citrate/2-methylcitrate synthase [Gemmatimonadota bacterium]
MVGGPAKGLEGVVAASTSLSFIDGLEGRLMYRGYSIHDLARHATFLESVFLLWKDRLPTGEELRSFEAELAGQRNLDDRLLGVLEALPATTPPMVALRTGVSAAGSYDPEAEDPSPEANLRKAARLVARLPTLVAAFARLRNGLEPIEPDPELPHAANLLYMVSGEKPEDMAVRALDRTLLLYLDHGLNASTFTCRVIAATLSDMYSAVTGGVGALKGPLHGGANAKAMEMLLEIGEPDRIEAYVDAALAEKRKLMGFGHRVYRTEDPRATHLREMSEELGKQTGQPKWFEMSRELERVMKDRKGLNPNVDFYCASVYYVLGIPIDLFTPLFAVGRIGGWTAHVMEQFADNRLIRPRAEYVGEKERPWVPLEAR